MTDRMTGSLTLWWDDPGTTPALVDAIVRAYSTGTPCTITGDDGVERSVRITRLVYDETAQYTYVEWIEEEEPGDTEPPT